MHIPTIERGPPSVPPPVPPLRAMGIMDPTPVESLRLVPRVAPLAGTVIGGTLLTWITFGIYRFWYRTELRRYYWDNTTLALDGFEYTGTGKELFVGFLIAMAIILPINFAATIAGFVAGAEVGATVGVMVAFVLFPALVQIAMFRARRYRLSRTRYRGVRFAQTGSGIAYLLRSIKWLILSLVTFGIVVPYWRTALARYRIEHSWFGDLKGQFTGRAHPLMTRWLLFWLNGVLALGAVALAAYFGERKADPGLIAGWGGAGFVLFCLTPLSWQAYKVAEFRAFTNATAFGTVRLTSDLRTRSVIWAWTRYGLALFAMLATPAALVLGYLALRGGLADPKALAADPPIFLGMLAPLVFIGWFILGTLIGELVLRRRLWVLKARSITVYNLEAIASVLQRAADGLGAIGEAFDTDFDIAG